MSRVRNILLAIVAVMMAVACGESRYISDTLEQAEAVMQEYPDSALTLLQTINPDELTTDRGRAMHALLLSQAYDKNYIDLTDDSLITIAVDYFAKRDNALMKFMSLFYQGRVYFNAKEYAKAMHSYLQAEKAVPYFDNDYLKGLLYTQMAYVYEEYYDYPKALKSYREAYSYYTRANLPKHSNYALYGIAAMYRSSSDTYNEAEQTLFEIIDASKLDNDSALMAICLSELIVHYVETKEFNKAKNAYDQFIELYPYHNANSSFYSVVALMFANLNNFETSEAYIKIAHDLSKTSEDTIHQIYNNAQIAALKADYESAYKSIVDGKRMENKNIRHRLEHPILSTQLKIMEQDIAYRQLKQQVQFYLFIGIITIILIFVTCASVYVRALIKNKQRKLDEYVELLWEQKQSIERNDRLSHELIQYLYKGHFKILNSLSDTYYSHTNDPKVQKYLYSEVTCIIEMFKQKKIFLELETMVNRYCDNSMQIIRANIPDLDESDYRQLCYHYAGFSGKLIGLLMNKSQANIYMRKSRLKEKISKLTNNEKHILLKHLE